MNNSTDKSNQFTMSDIKDSNISGVAGGDFSGNVTQTITQLKESTQPEDAKMGDLLEKLQTVIEDNDSGLSERDKTKALKHLNAIAKLAKDRNNSNLKDLAENALDALPTILKRGTGLLKLIESQLGQNLDQIMGTIQEMLAQD
ncbi:hypothetical protein [Okeania sp. SIO2B9]|uniref:hypothetical protein n=1 Tax=Okeania sp. SIO2B9 TaxID=2607782 RepID=UPI00142C8FD8|nr:hypothetical protein [Okeania sp. SIO2B9]NES92959.1 hypothetical protein [Okeania sp. SIO2B9]